MPLPKGSLPNRIKLPFLGIEVDGKKFEKDIVTIINKIKSERLWAEKLVKDAKSLIAEGLNLDNVSTKTLLFLLITKGTEDFTNYKLRSFNQKIRGRQI
ncbi:MAG: hypothetical protein QXX08_05495 [Candidatus Bathyarchaeia archaeon]